jgi:predicted anti-sigma-YlaC factor YlaD
MLKCLFLRRRLYDYLDNTLSEIDKIKVSKHLDICHNCRTRASQIRDIIDLSSRKMPPKPDDAFWHNFKIDLDKSLNKALVKPVRLERKRIYLLRPALVYISALMFIFLVGSYFSQSRRFPVTRIAQEDALVEEILSLDEIDEASYANNLDDADLLEEVILLDQINQA